MPEISPFFSITIRLYYREHLPPQFHAQCGEHEVVVDILTLTVFGGQMAPRAMGMVIEWASLHREALLDLWQRAASRQSLYKVPALE